MSGIRRPIRTHSFVFLAAMVLFVGGNALAQNQVAQKQTAQSSANKFVGSETCKGCHQPIWDKFNRNAHFRSVASKKEPPERTGCEGCHGPGNNHVESFGAKGTIVTFPDMPKEKVLDTCLTCHTQTDRKSVV